MAGSFVNIPQLDPILSARIETLACLAYHLSEPVMGISPTHELVYANASAKQLSPQVGYSTSLKYFLSMRVCAPILSPTFRIPRVFFSLVATLYACVSRLSQEQLGFSLSHMTIV